MPTEQQIQEAIKRGYTPEQIKLVMARKGVNKPQRQGVSKWLFGDSQGTPSMALNAAANVFSLPSYAIGGVLDSTQDGLDIGDLNVFKNAGRGVRDKKAVMTELPETFGIDPNSGKGMALGFAGELLTPGIPIGKAAKLLKGGKAASRLKPNIFAKGAGIKDDIAQTLLTKSYKLNDKDVKDIAQAIGVTRESEKLPRVIEYLESLGLSGSSRKSLKQLDNIVDPMQDKLNSMVRTDTPMNRLSYALSLEKQADELEIFAGDPNTRKVAQALRDEAKTQKAFVKHKVPFTDTYLRNTTTSAFDSATPSQMNSPFDSGFNEQVGRAGIKALDTFAPGSAEIGTKLRGVRTAQDVIGKKARTGIGNQIFNALKPGAAGFGLGAGYGLVQGEDPLTSGIAGTFAGVGVNNPRVQNVLGKTLNSGIKVNPAVSKGFKAGMKYGVRVPSTAVRVGTISNQSNSTIQPRATERPSKYQQGAKPTDKLNRQQYMQPTSYNPNQGQAFGSNVRLRRSSAY